MKENKIKIEFLAKSINESFARMTVAYFMVEMNPTLDEVDDVKTAVSEAVTNSIIHGYMEEDGRIEIECSYIERLLEIRIRDWGVGIEDVKKAMEPLYTTRPDEERSGMGFSFMEAFMDSVEVESKPGEGTLVIMKKMLSGVDDAG